MPSRLLLFALSLALLLAAGCDVTEPGDGPPGPPDPPVPQTFDDTPVALQTALHQTGAAEMTVFNTGFQGGMTGSSADQAFAYLGQNVLYEGQLLVGASASQVSGQPYSVQASASEPNWTDGSALQALLAPAPFRDGYRTRFTDAGAGNPTPLGLTVTQRSFSTDDPAAAGAVVFVFDVTNGGAAQDSLYVGLFADFDLSTPATNRGGFDAEARAVYTLDATGSVPFAVGIASLSDPVGGWSATMGGLASGLTDAILYRALSTPGEAVPADPYDVRSVVGVGPFRLAAGATRRVAFAYVAGADLAGLRASAAAARTRAAAVLSAP